MCLHMAGSRLALRYCSPRIGAGRARPRCLVRLAAWVAATRSSFHRTEGRPADRLRLYGHQLVRRRDQRLGARWDSLEQNFIFEKAASRQTSFRPVILRMTALGNRSCIRQFSMDLSIFLCVTRSLSLAVFGRAHDSDA